MGFHISGFNILIGNEAGDAGQLEGMMQSDVNETIKFLNEIHELTKEFSANDTLDRYLSSKVETTLTNPLLISTGFLKYPFGHLFQTEIKIQL